MAKDARCSERCGILAEALTPTQQNLDGAEEVMFKAILDE